MDIHPTRRMGAPLCAGVLRRAGPLLALAAWTALASAATPPPARNGDASQGVSRLVIYRAC
jgi:hypothetical protein